jgi:type II secretory pathway component PulF
MFFATAWLLVPRFKIFSSDFGVDLPWYTVFVVKFSHLVIIYARFVPAVLVLIVAADWGMLRLLRLQTGGWSWLWSGLILFLPLAGLLGMFVAMVIPLAGLHSRLTG